MQDRFFVVVSREGFQRAAKTDRVDLKPGERFFPIEMDIPDEAFAPPSLPTIKLVIPAAALSGPIAVEATAGGENGQ